MRLTCSACAASVEPETLVCERCGGTTFTQGIARIDPDRWRPSFGGNALPFPWSVLRTMDGSSVVTISGPPGSGKTAICAQLTPDFWLTTEQTTEQAAGSIGWARNGCLWRGLEIAEIAGLDQFSGRLGGIWGPVTVVLDSLTRIGSLQAQFTALELAEKWAQQGTGRRFVAVQQVTKDGKAAGLRALEHLTTAILSITVEETGLRRIGAVKNRRGPLASTYYALTEKGLSRPKLPYSYSVEGRAGAYHLHPIGLEGGRWGGVLAEFFEVENKGEYRAGLAHCGRPAPGYPGDQIAPPDVIERRRFAESHGLKWLEWEKRNG